MKKFNQFMSESKGYGDVNRQVAAAQDKADRTQAKNVTTKGKKLGVLADPYSGKPTKQEVWEYKGKKWLVLGKSVEVFVPMKYHKVIKENFVLRDGEYLKKGTAVKWKAADGKEVEGKIVTMASGRYIDEILVTKSKSKFYKPGDYAYDVYASDIGVTWTEDIKQIVSERREWRPDDFRVGQKISYEVGEASNWKTGKVIRKGGKYTGTITSTYVRGAERGTLVVKNDKTGKSDEVWMHTVIDILKEDIERVDENTMYPAAHLKKKGKWIGATKYSEYYLYQDIVYTITADNRVGNLGSMRHFKKNATAEMKREFDLSEDIEQIDEGFKQLKNLKMDKDIAQSGQMPWYRKIVKGLKQEPGNEIVLVVHKQPEEYTEKTGIGNSTEIRIQPISNIGFGKTQTEKWKDNYGTNVRTTKVIAINESQQIDELFGRGKKKKQKEKKEKLQNFKDKKADDVSKYGIHRDHGIKNGQHIEFIWAYGKGASSKSSSKNTIIGKVVGQAPESDGDLYKVKVVKSNNPKIAVGKTINRVYYTQIVRVLSGKIAEEIANAAGGALGSNPSTGSIAGYDPMLSKKPLKRSKFAGTECFEVDNDTFQKCHTGHGKYERWDKYLKDECDTCKNIREYAKRHPQKDIVIQREGCGTMTYLKRKGVHY